MLFTTHAGTWIGIYEGDRIFIFLILDIEIWWQGDKIICGEMKENGYKSGPNKW